MEEDDETARALPRWVELEYNVCFHCFYLSAKSNRSLFAFISVAYENTGRFILHRQIYTSVSHRTEISFGRIHLCTFSSLPRPLFPS